jgi:glycosyltransferase involved in cell wall biosynthesis
MANSKISIIIRTRGEERHIGYAIQSCIDNFDNPEIIIIDDNSKDQTLKIVSLFDKYDIKVYNIKENYSPGYSINLGVSKCSNELILVLSAHCQIIKMDLEIVKSYLSKYRAVFGNQTPIFNGKKITKRYLWSHFGNSSIVNMYSEIEERYFLHNAFCFYEKEFLIANPFDEKYSGKEDRHWAINLVDNLKEQFLYTPEIQVNHFYTRKGATWKGLG